MQTLVVRCLRARLLGRYKALEPTYGDPVTSIMVENESSAHRPARQASTHARACDSPFPLTKPGPPRGSSRVGLFGVTGDCEYVAHQDGGKGFAGGGVEVHE